MTPSERLTAMYRAAGIDAEFGTTPSRRQMTVLVNDAHLPKVRKQLDALAKAAGFTPDGERHYDADEDLPAQTYLAYRIAGDDR